MVLSWTLLSCSTPPPPPPASLVIITMDTTRADHIGAYGDADAQTPTIDQLAAEGLRFDRAYATVPLTIPAHASIFSGLYPPRHGIHTNGDAILPDEITTLAEHLKGAGYRTGASVSAFVTSQIWGFSQGFDVYYDDVHAAKEGIAGRWGKERPAGETIRDAISWLEGQDGTPDQPFFLWVHLFDAHDPYAPPPPFDEQFADRPYDGEIAYIDQELGRLRAAVESAAPDGGAAWIVVGDHGEALEREHGERSHGLFLFDPTTRVPFIVRPAKPLDNPLVASGAVSIADVMPTALGMLGLPVPDDLDGVNLAPELTGTTVPRRAVYMESYTVQQRFGFHPEIAMAKGDLKLMDTPDARLYNLAEDPGETDNQLSQRAVEVARLREQLAVVESSTVETDDLNVSPELAQRLESLGYMSGSHAPASERSTIDAKQQLDLLGALEETRHMNIDGASPEALEVAYRAILAKNPDLREAQTGLARTLQRQHRYEEALAIFDAALEEDASSAVLQINRANLLAGMDRKEDALAAMEAVLLQVPRDDLARTGALKLLTDLGLTDEAEQRAREWLEMDPDELNVKAHLGILLARRGEMAEAGPLLEASLADNVPRQYVYRMLAQVALAQQQPQQAIQYLRIETEHFPRNIEARMSLGNLLMRLGNWQEAAAEFNDILSRQPTHVEARRGRAQAFFNSGDYAMAEELLAPLLESSPDDPLVLLLQANILSKQGKMDKAKAVFARAQTLRGQTPPEAAP